MSINRTILHIGVIASIFAFSACSGSHEGASPRKSMNVSGKSPIYVKGAEDGCTTANGDYTKDHHAFNTNYDYHEGWFAGRKYCEVHYE